MARSSKSAAAAVRMAAAGAVALALSACGGGTVYDSYKPLGEWNRTDTALFRVPPVAEAGAYAAEIGLRTNADYPFKAVTVIVDCTVLPAGTVVSDTLNCRLADDDGNTLGSGQSNFQHVFPVRRLRLSGGDSLVVAVRHHMMRETLPGIEDVGLRIRRSGAN